MLPMFNMQVQQVLVLKQATTFGKSSCANRKMGEVESVHSLNKLHCVTTNLMTKAWSSEVRADKVL